MESSYVTSSPLYAIVPDAEIFSRFIFSMSDRRKRALTAGCILPSIAMFISDGITGFSSGRFMSPEMLAFTAGSPRRSSAVPLADTHIVPVLA